MGRRSLLIDHQPKQVYEWLYLRGELSGGLGRAATVNAAVLFIPAHSAWS